MKNSALPVGNAVVSLTLLVKVDVERLGKTVLVGKLVVPDDVVTPNVLFVPVIATVVIAPTRFGTDVAEFFGNFAGVGDDSDVGVDVDSVAFVKLTEIVVDDVVGDVAALTTVDVVGENNVAITSTKVINSEIVADPVPSLDAVFAPGKSCPLSKDLSTTMSTREIQVSLTSSNLDIQYCFAHPRPKDVDRGKGEGWGKEAHTLLHSYCNESAGS